ncbi:AAA domain-containing protein [Nocardia cyriacigeorgica]|uniref:AAA domain-containing protein n=2 Tax=Nocardia cyriacigeorgica TaxID=135487 RepID=A0A2L2JXB4_9NOCA|nr:ATP-binding protein [Nocardia cyriacigeorgica]MBF6323526.1 AAA family ATPase [Nocardia cyriacigeorgica]NEW36381.1 AAA domain-containing protein [Nocardia cyriacigeorgica]
MEERMDLDTALASFDRTTVAERIAEGEQQRKQIVEHFPLEQWPTMRLEQYALGIDRTGEPTYCRMLEFIATEYGSLGGGSAGKHIIYRHKSGEWRLAAQLAGLGVNEAWERLRGEFVAAFDAAERQAFDDIDDLDVLTSGQALVTKSLAAYYPQHFLPIYSRPHLRAFISLLGGTPERNATAWRANRHLSVLVKDHPGLSELTSREVARFLYTYFDPRPKSRVVWKIAPGENARHWPDCLAQNYIRVGWDEVGDLAQYTSDTELKHAIDNYWSDRPGGNLVKARNLLAFRDLEPGDRIVANRGKTHVLAVGTVSGGYYYNEDLPEYRHIVPVDWDTSLSQDLAEPQNAWVPTFAKVPEKLFAQLTDRSANDGGGHDPAPVDLPTEIIRVQEALARKGQVILYGPPGTGKTRLALQSALAMNGGAAAIGTAGQESAIGNMLRSGRVQLVTFHPSYGYEDFVEGYKPVDDPAAHGLLLELTNGLFHNLCTAAAAAPDETFLLIIDEINRGDLPRIFGELITLLESDKRGIEVRLPISKRSFSVPKNLRIIGTMNTADRSVSHLDAAIRRRFAFVDIGPDPDIVSGSVGPLDLTTFLTSLNTRVAACLDPDHQIGHAYLLTDSEPVATDEELAAAFYHDIVPLLEDYCVGRVELLRELLGNLVDQNTGRPAQIAVADVAAELAAEFTVATSRNVDA